MGVEANQFEFQVCAMGVEANLLEFQVYAMGVEANRLVHRYNRRVELEDLKIVHKCRCKLWCETERTWTIVYGAQRTISAFFLTSLFLLRRCRHPLQFRVFLRRLRCAE